MKVKVGQWWWAENIDGYYYIGATTSSLVIFQYFSGRDMGCSGPMRNAMSVEEFSRTMTCLLFDDVEPPGEARRPRKESLLCPNR